MKKLCLIAISAFLISVPVQAAESVPSVSAAASILVHPATGRVLYAKNENDPRLIASTTKLMTALVTVRNTSLDKTAEIRQEWTEVEGSAMYLRPGESYSVRELLQGLLLSSGNDAAIALAGIVAGNTDRFVAMMNDAAAQLGLENTRFANPHGLDAADHYSTAADLASLMKTVCAEDDLCKIMGLHTCSVHGVLYENHNKLLRSCKGVFAGKTGYTKAAGRCLVSCCERDGMELICVTLSDPDDWRDHAALYDWAYSAFREVKVTAADCPGEVCVIDGAKATVGTVPENDVVLCLEKDASLSISSACAPFLLAPVCRGEYAGEMTISLDGAPIRRISLLCAGDVRSGDETGKTFRQLADRLIGIYVT